MVKRNCRFDNKFKKIPCKNGIIREFIRKYCYANYIHHHLVLNREIRPNSLTKTPATTGQYIDIIKTENLFYENSLFFNAKFLPNSLLEVFLVQNKINIIHFKLC